MTFYNLRSNPSPNLPYTIIKFDADLNPESTYNLGRTICECPAGHRPTCRHRSMLPILLEKIDTAWFFCFETKRWEDPTGNAAEHDEVAEFDEATGGLSEGELASIEQAPNEGTELTGLQEEQILMGFHQPELVKELKQPRELTQAEATPFRRRV
jgi:hypothetical protein